MLADCFVCVFSLSAIVVVGAVAVCVSVYNLYVLSVLFAIFFLLTSSDNATTTMVTA